MAFTRTYTDAEPQRVNRWLAQSGVCSRREAEGLIAQGLVTIDGEQVDDPGRKILPGQTLVLADAATGQLESSLSILINKPVGYVSAQPEPGQTPAARLITRKSMWGDPTQVPASDSLLAPLGRLDMDSRGLLLLSEDGVLAKAVIGPASDLEKEYVVRVEGPITDRKLILLCHGLSLDQRELKPAKVNRIGGQSLRFVLKEGRNRQIRRMCEAVDLHVEDLFRVRIGTLKIGDLPEGMWRALMPDERAALIAASAPRGEDA